MLTNIPYAPQYVLMPVGDPSKIILIGDDRPCGISQAGRPPMTFSLLLMNELGRVIDDGDIVGVGGISDARCMIIVNLSTEHCYEILDGALIAVDEIFKRDPDLAPVGGFGFDVRDWDDIPDSEKAGKKK